MAKRDFAALLGTRSGGAYIPPSRLRAMQLEAAKDKTSAEYQRLSWDALRKSLNGLINKVRTAIQHTGVISQELTRIGQRVEYKAHCARAVWREPYPR